MKIELRNIHKHYGVVRANDGVSLTISPGTIHGILGENGAGKSTLMKVLSGYTRKTDGAIFLDDLPVDFVSPAQAVQLGLGMLYQDPLDFPHLSVLENFMAGRPGGVAEKRGRSRRKLNLLADGLGFRLCLDDPVRLLTVGERQQLEILRLLDLGVEVIILDEPTTGISAVQKDTLFQALRRLAKEGRTVVLVSHKLEDIDALCDRVSVLRQGKVSGHAERPFDADRLMEMMFGARPIPPRPLRAQPGEIILEMHRTAASGGRTGLKPCSAVVRQGEVVGLAGLEGSGQGLFLRLAAGLQAPISGSIHLEGQCMDGADHHRFQRQGVAFLPASRLEEGLIAEMCIYEHMALQERGFWVKWQQARETAAKNIEAFKVKGRPESRVDGLSGGNQQRLLLSFLPQSPRLLLLENPTRGLDVESVHWVWEHLLAYSAAAAGVIFSSSELDEILMVADRVMVFFDGRIIKDVPADQTNPQELGLAIAGRQ